MASELRVNTINSRSGLGTITVSDTGAVFTGITTIGSVTVDGGTVTGNLTGTASTATASATAYGLSGSPTLSGITSVSTTNLTVNGNAYPAAGPLSNRNKIINGDMRIDQRNGGASFTMTGDSQYTLDRWITRTYAGPGRFSVDQNSASPNNIDPSAKLTVTTTDTPGTYGYAFGHRVEGYNFSDLAYGSAAAKSATISFWVRSSLTGTYCFSVRNSDGSRSYVAEYSISSADTWEYKTITFAGDTSGTWLTSTGIGAILEWSLGSETVKQTTAGSWQSGNYVTTSNQTDWIATNGATFYITGVQLEVGSVATPFEYRSFGDELARCQRYFVKNHGVLLEGYMQGGGSAMNYQSHWPVTMRQVPNITLSYQVGTANESGSSAKIDGMTYRIVGTAAGHQFRYDLVDATAEL